MSRESGITAERFASHRPAVIPLTAAVQNTAGDLRKVSLSAARFALRFDNPAGELDVLLEALGMKETQR